MRTVGRRSIQAVLIAGVTVAGVAIGSPAHADWTSCSTSYGCAWQDSSWPGGPNSYFQYNVSYNYSSFNNQASSIVNAGYCGSYSTTRFSDNFDYTGDYRDLFCPASGKQSRDPYLANGTNANSANFDNRISSARFVNVT